MIDVTTLTKAQKHKMLNELIVAKFGRGHGTKVAAFEATGMAHVSYFYSMTSGNTSVPAKVLQTLAALPDFTPEPLYIAPIDPVISTHHGDYVLHINKDTANLLAWFLKRTSPQTLTSSHCISALFPKMLRSHIQSVPEHAFALKDYDEAAEKRSREKELAKANVKPKSPEEMFADLEASAFD